jgi:uncharacterized SAM-binding protein YcdF (DUF218 family)
MKTSDTKTGRGCLGKSFVGCSSLVIGIPLLLLIIFIGLWGLGGILVIADRLQSSDAIVVLSGGDNERVKYAANLYRNGYGRYLILTETGISYPGNPKPATARAIDLAIDQGVPEELILTPEAVVNSTADEAQIVKNTAVASDFTSLIVVTDPYHTFRTRLIFQWIFRGSGIKIMVHPTSAHWYDSMNWFLSLNGWRTTLSEYIKTVGFLIGFR